MICNVAKVVSNRRKWRERQRQGLLRSWQPGGAHDLRFRHKEPDAETLRRRAADDRRGQVILRGTVQTAAGPQPLLICWSTTGRIDQLDVVIAGRVLATAAARGIVPALLKLAY